MTIRRTLTRFAPLAALAALHSVAPATLPAQVRTSTSASGSASTGGGEAGNAYRAAQQELDRGNNAGAADRFGRIASQYPTSPYAADALYWQAWSFYRLGGASSLERARASLDSMSSRYAAAYARGDAPALRARVVGALARAGDERATVQVREIAEGGERTRDAAASARERADRDAARQARRGESAGRAQPACEGDEMRLEAINALMQMDHDRAVPILRQVLSRRDACSAALRRKAVFVLSQQDGSGAAELLIATARSDPDEQVRREAVRWLGNMEDARVVPVLDSLLRHGDEGLRESALFALANGDHASGREAIRRYAQDASTPEAGVRRAVFALGHWSGTPDDAEFLRGLYGRTTSQSLKRDLIQSLSQVEGGANAAWLLGIAGNASEDLEVRKHALFWAAQSDMPTADLVGILPRLGTNGEMRQQWVFVLAQRDDRAAVDRLIEVARGDPDRELRRRAIFWLGQKDDPRVQQVLLEIIDKP